MGLLYLITQKLIGNRTAAAVATAIFAISPAWWSQATIAEVYALSGLLFLSFLYASAAVGGVSETKDRRPETGDERETT